MPSNYGLVSNALPNNMLPVFGMDTASASMYGSLPHFGNLQGHAMDASPLDVASSTLSGGLSTDNVAAQPTLSTLPNGACIPNIYSMLNAFPSPELIAAAQAQSQSNLGSSISLAYLMNHGAHSEQ
uniref:Uncharacterized protein n=2 Tax=Chlamydomonas euryale TaxID=1486919 RepID=A0A7R9YRY6_9CHLO|mmetsp:Transcript_14962/g.43998  ORF Transcript_14962/g.43998 Transcript_14962/m.43998 type:complete len:126 (+) Transcript_14962:1096-1473(+)